MLFYKKIQLFPPLKYSILSCFKDSLDKFDDQNLIMSYKEKLPLRSTAQLEIGNQI